MGTEELSPDDDNRSMEGTQDSINGSEGVESEPEDGSVGGDNITDGERIRNEALAPIEGNPSMEDRKESNNGNEGVESEPENETIGGNDMTDGERIRNEASPPDENNLSEEDRTESNNENEGVESEPENETNGGNDMTDGERIRNEALLPDKNNLSEEDRTELNNGNEGVESEQGDETIFSRGTLIRNEILDIRKMNEEVKERKQNPTHVCKTPKGSLDTSRSTPGSSESGGVAVVEKIESKKFVDPILKAAATGAAARKAKHYRFVEREQQRRIDQQEKRRVATTMANNEWKWSLRRFASAAASTATKVANVTAPVLKDASSIVATSAKEFANDFQEEWKKEFPDRKFLHQEESVILHPFSPPGKLELGLSSPKCGSDWSPGSSQSEGSSRAIEDPTLPHLPLLTHSLEQKVQLKQRTSPPSDDAAYIGQKSDIEKKLGRQTQLPDSKTLAATSDTLIERDTELSSGQNPDTIVTHEGDNLVEKVAETDDQSAIQVVEADTPINDSHSISYHNAMVAEQECTQNAMLQVEKPLTVNNVPRRQQSNPRTNSALSDVPAAQSAEDTKRVMSDSVTQKSLYNNDGDAVVKKDEGIHQQTPLARSALFDSNENCIYEGNAISDRPRPEKIKSSSIEENRIDEEHTLRPIESAFPVHARKLLETPKFIMKSLVTELTGKESGTAKNSPIVDYIEPSAHKVTVIPKSVFLQERDFRSSGSISSPGSPPEDLHFPDRDCSRSLAHSSASEEVTFWDLVPAKRDVGPTKFKANSTENDVDGPTAGVEEIKEKIDVESESNFRAESKKGSAVPEEFQHPNGKGNEGSQLATESNERLRGAAEPLMVGWQHDTSAAFPGVPDSEDMTEVFSGEGVLEEVLFSFSSLEDVSFLRKIPRQKRSEQAQSYASIIWRLLLAKWKHSEIWKAMLARPCSPFRSVTRGATSAAGTESVSSSSTIDFQFRESSTFFSNAGRDFDKFSVMRNLSGLKAQSDGDLAVLSGLICEIGTSPSISKEATEALKHKFLSNSEDTKAVSPNVTGLLEEAESQMPGFSQIVNQVVNFSSQNELPNNSLEPVEVTYSLSLKHRASVRRKADRKYGGDILQVKDVLRGQITFPDGGALICGLYCLNTLAKKSVSSHLQGSPKGLPRIEIVRIKNLFRTSSIGCSYYKPLPTGYRHILVNLRLNDGILAGKHHMALRL